MLGAGLAKVFGSKNDRMVKKYRHVVNRINALDETISPLENKAQEEKTVE